MAESKIHIKVGAVEFSGEGDAKWLSAELDKLLEKIPDLARVPSHPKHDHHSAATGDTLAPESKATGSLGSYLKASKATSNQIRKFLAVAVWLHDRTSLENIATKDVTKALSDNHQSKLTNPAHCLNQNVRKGFCEKSGKEFFVTAEGRENLTARSDKESDKD